MENVWFSKTTWGCAKWICRGWERQIADKPRLYAVFVFGCLVFKEVLHEWQSLANGKDGGCHLFYLFSWPLVLFTRGCLPLSQQYPPLNRKPRSGFRFLISPEPVDVWPPLAKNACGLWGRECLVPRACARFRPLQVCFFLPFQFLQQQEKGCQTLIRFKRPALTMNHITESIIRGVFPKIVRSIVTLTRPPPRKCHTVIQLCQTLLQVFAPFPFSRDLHLLSFLCCLTAKRKSMQIWLHFDSMVVLASPNFRCLWQYFIDSLYIYRGLSGYRERINEAKTHWNRTQLLQKPHKGKDNRQGSSGRDIFYWKFIDIFKFK